MKWCLALVAALLLAGCGGGARPTASPRSTPAFNLSAVKANFHGECVDPVVVDDLFCEQVKIDGMTADGDILNVATGLNAAAKDRAEAICNQVALAHFDGQGADLGYEIIGVLEKDGGNAAACFAD